MTRILAFILVLLPGILAVLGVKIIRDAFFGILYWPIPFAWLQMIAGLLLIAIGLAFVGGFIYRRDKKRDKLNKEGRRRKKLNH